MADNQLPKRFFYGKLSKGKHHHGHPKKRYKDSLKESLRRFEIDLNTWEDSAMSTMESDCLSSTALTQQWKSGLKGNHEQTAAEYPWETTCTKTDK